MRFHRKENQRTLKGKPEDAGKPEDKGKSSSAKNMTIVPAFSYIDYRNVLFL
jgi:hypothetical protein